MIYFSHRGANTHCVQNTTSAFSLAHAQGARYFELDVHLLKDGALAIHHDYSLASTAGVDVQLKDLTTADLKKYPLHNSFTSDIVYVPLLQDVLAVIRPDLKLLNIELKNDGNIYPGLEAVLLKALPVQLLPKILFSSFDYPTLQRLRALSANVRIGQLTRQFQVAQPLTLRAESVHINYKRFTPQIAQVCHRNHLNVYCYTVNEPLLVKQLASQGVDGIFTDCIERFV